MQGGFTDDTYEQISTATMTATATSSRPTNNVCFSAGGGLVGWEGQPEQGNFPTGVICCWVTHSSAQSQHACAHLGCISRSHRGSWSAERYGIENGAGPARIGPRTSTSTKRLPHHVHRSPAQGLPARLLDTGKKP